MKDEALQLSIVFKALTRPPTLFGVDYDYALVEGMVVFLAFINTHNFLAFILIIPFHLIGYVLCKIDTHIFRIISVRASIGAVKNKKLWGCQSYESF